MKNPQKKVNRKIEASYIDSHMHTEITENIDLLDDTGKLTRPGWAKFPYFHYDRTKIKTNWARIKEWDYYYVIDHKTQKGFALTISDIGFLGLIAIHWFDFKNKIYYQDTAMKFFPKGNLKLPPSSESGITQFSNKKLSMKFEVIKEQATTKRILSFDCPTFKTEKGKIPIKGEIILTQENDHDSMVIATPWKENPQAFYYNRKINCMPAQGMIKLGEEEFNFSAEGSFGALDWGRGNWTYKNTWYWGSASGQIDGNRFGFNIGYGFGDTSAASENMIFYNGKAHKFDQITFELDPKNYLEPWKFTSNDGRFKMIMEPIFDRNAPINAGFIKSIQHQVFGYFTGDVILDDGKKVHIDKMLAFAEHVINWW